MPLKPFKTSEVPKSSNKRRFTVLGVKHTFPVNPKKPPEKQLHCSMEENLNPKP